MTKYVRVAYEAAADGGAGGAGAGAGGGAAQPWYSGKLDDAGVGYLQTRGIHDKSPEEVALNVIKAHREAQVLLRAPQEQLLNVPKDASDEAGWNAVHTRLGRPEKPDGYAFEGRKGPDGKDRDEGLAKAFRDTAFKRGVPKDAAEALWKSAREVLEHQETSTATVRKEAGEQDKRELDAEWGLNAAALRVTAMNAAQRLGFTPDTVNALEGQVGYKGVMKMFAQLGQMMGEDKHVLGNPNVNNGIVTKEQAIHKMTQLKTDKEWTKRYLNGDAEAKREFAALTRVMSGV
jgi:hypothetical protein